MFPPDLKALLVDRLRAAGDERIKTVTDFEELSEKPKPFGVRIEDSEGRSWDVQIVTTAPSNGRQTSWEE